MSKKEYFDGPTAVSAEQTKRDRARNPERDNEDMIRKNEELMRKVETMRAMNEEFEKMSQRCKTFELDLKQSNTNLQHYKERTKALQKQVDGLKSGKFKSDNVPNFKTPNPNQQIIRALLNENEDLNKRLERMNIVKDKVMRKTEQVDKSDILDALVHLEEENKDLRSQLNLKDTSSHSFMQSEDENMEISQLRERLQMSVNKTRDQKQLIESLQKETDHIKWLLEEKSVRLQQFENYMTQPRPHPPIPPHDKNPSQMLPRGDLGIVIQQDLHYPPPFVTTGPRGGAHHQRHFPGTLPGYGHSPSPPPHSAMLPTMQPQPVTGERHNKPRTSPHPPHSSFLQSPDNMYYK